jgi:hypothetical protein
LLLVQNKLGKVFREIQANAEICRVAVLACRATTFSDIPLRAVGKAIPNKRQFATRQWPWRQRAPADKDRYLRSAALVLDFLNVSNFTYTCFKANKFYLKKCVNHDKIEELQIKGKIKSLHLGNITLGNLAICSLTLCSLTLCSFTLDTLRLGIFTLGKEALGNLSLGNPFLGNFGFRLKSLPKL